jgi:hypothetical protein
MPALVGGPVAALAAAFLALVLPAGAGHPTPDSHPVWHGSSVTGTRTALPQLALPTITETAVGTALRLTASGGCPPVSVHPIVAHQATEPPNTAAGVAAVSSRPPLHILLRTWLNQRRCFRVALPHSASPAAAIARTPSRPEAPSDTGGCPHD